ncbi:MAG: hypothetical protein DMG30_00175 [Acidobacteria bacterium]|nr:MAG: hypothetical protein DMG30_00175 [Acidobacteriota bacterium]
MRQKICKPLFGNARPGFCIGDHPRGREVKLTMHREDKAELLATAAQIERHALQLLTGSLSASETENLQRIIVLARYMREHLEMLRESPHVSC